MLSTKMMYKHNGYSAKSNLICEARYALPRNHLKYFSNLEKNEKLHTYTKTMQNSERERERESGERRAREKDSVHCYVLYEL